MQNDAKFIDGRSGGRLLVYFPIVHSQADLGALGELVERIKIRRLGRHAWGRNLRLIDELWARIEESIAGLNLCYEHVRVYQDGLPECGSELNIVAELAKAGSRNHQLLLHLHERGAKVMGTESPELLIEEYQSMARELTGDINHAPGAAASRKPTRDSLLERRDQYIATRINGTLIEGETGILFLGMLHSVSNLLGKDIKLVYPLGPPWSIGGNAK